MAEQKGILPLQGTIGNITFFKSGDGYRVRARSGVTKTAIATRSNFNRTRENLTEFASAGRAGKVLRKAFGGVLDFASDKRMTSRLTREMMRVLKADEKSDRGQRNVIDGEAMFLEGFNFNEQGQLHTSFLAPFTATADRATGELKITVPIFIPSKLVNAPPSATHFQLISAGAEIDFENETYKEDTHNSAEIPWTNAPTTEIVLSNTVTPNSTHPLFLVFGVQYYQQVNGSMYALQDRSFNTLSIVKVSTP